MALLSQSFYFTTGQCSNFDFLNLRGDIECGCYSCINSHKQITNTNIVTFLIGVVILGVFAIPASIPTNKLPILI